MNLDTPSAINLPHIAEQIICTDIFSNCIQIAIASGLVALKLSPLKPFFQEAAVGRGVVGDDEHYPAYQIVDGSMINAVTGDHLIGQRFW